MDHGPAAPVVRIEAPRLGLDIDAFTVDAPERL
jgi:hypothetical protein